MAISALLAKDTTKVQGGGGLLYVAEHDAAKTPYGALATVKTPYTTGTSLVCYDDRDFSASGALNVDIFGASPETNQTFNSVSSGTFTLASGLAGGHAARAIVQEYAANLYAPSAWKCLGYLGGSSMPKSGQNTDVFSEEDELIATLTGQKAVQLDTVIQQAMKDEIDFFYKEAEDGLYALMYVVPRKTLGSLFIVANMVQILSTPNTQFQSNQVSAISASIKFIKNGDEELFMAYQG